MRVFFLSISLFVLSLSLNYETMSACINSLFYFSLFYSARIPNTHNRRREYIDRCNENLLCKITIRDLYTLIFPMHVVF